MYKLSMYKLIVGVLCFLTTIIDETAPVILSNDRKSIEGFSFRVSAFEYQPIMYSLKNGKDKNNTYKGFSVDLLNWMAELYHFNLIYVPESPAQIAKYGIGGLGQALIEQLVNDQVDFVPWAIGATPAIAAIIDLTIPMRVMDFTMLQRWPSEESRLTAVIRPFTYDVWILILFSCFFLILMMSVLEIKGHLKRQTNTGQTLMQALNQHSIYVMTVITGQGNSITQKSSVVFRIMVGLWCLMMVVVVNAYTGTLTSLLTATQLEPIINSWKELAANGITQNRQVTIDMNSAMAKEFLNATSGEFKLFGDQLRREPKLQFKNFPALIENIVQYNCVYPSLKEISDYLIASDLALHGGICRMTDSKLLGTPKSYSFGMSKGGLFNRIINKDLQILWENGLLNYWVKQYIPVVDKCMADKVKPHGKLSALKLMELSSPFLLFGIGTILSFTTFLVEKLLIPSIMRIMDECLSMIILGSEHEILR